MIPEWFRVLCMIFLTVVICLFFLGLIIVIYVVGREAINEYVDEKRRERKRLDQGNNQNR